MRTGHNKDVEPGHKSCISRAVTSVRPAIGLDPVGGGTRPPICRRRLPWSKFQSRPGCRRCRRTLLLVSHFMSPTSSLQKHLFFGEKKNGLGSVGRNGTVNKLWRNRRTSMHRPGRGWGGCLRWCTSAAVLFAGHESVSAILTQPLERIPNINRHNHGRTETEGRRAGACGRPCIYIVGSISSAPSLCASTTVDVAM